MTARVSIERSASLPDPVRVARCRRVPELGPRILFLSGGSALRKVARRLKLHTHNSVHLVTPFDSGGSSAELRRAFHMLSVGDLRNRLLSLADESVQGNPAIYALFSHRLPGEGRRKDHAHTLDQMLAGRHPLVERVPDPLRQIVIENLRGFVDAVPADFDLRRASIGNLILAGGYLANDLDINAVAFLFSRLVEVRGLVRPIVEADLHLCAELESGERVVGQHRLTAKGPARIGSPVADLQLVDSLDPERAVRVEQSASEDVCALIRQAELICFPIGSFYSSVIANLLPRGVGRAIADARCPKVYVPNMGQDVEQHGMSLARSVETIVRMVRRDAGEDTPIERILNLVLVDSESGRYELPTEPGPVSAMGVQVVDLPLVRPHGWPLIDAEELVQVLVSLV